MASTEIARAREKGLFDVHLDYNTLAASANQLTRRWVWIPEHRWLEYYDYKGYYDQSMIPGTEPVKKILAENLGLQYLVHTRIKVTSTSLLQEDRRYWLDMRLTLRWYRKAMRMDIDIRDTIRNIKDLHIREKDPIWLPPAFEPPKKKIKPKGKK